MLIVPKAHHIRARALQDSVRARAAVTQVDLVHEPLAASMAFRSVSV